ncbi:MAG: hypothetical protein V3T83_10310 [Acidobacteriota bacterium]
MFKYLWLPFCWLTLQADPVLEQTVRDFWAALEARDKAQAMQFVHPDDLNKFLNRNEPRFEDWKLEAIEPASGTEATVTVNISRRFPGGSLLPVRAREVWQQLDSGWKVRIQSLEDYQTQLRQHQDRPPKLPPRLDIFPKTIKFYPHSDQPGVIVIRNGLNSPVQVVGLRLDEQKFEVSRGLTEVAAQSVGRIALHYLGSERQLNLESQLRLKLKVADEVREFQIPVLYNYTDPILEWLKRQKQPQPTKPPPQR